MSSVNRIPKMVDAKSQLPLQDKENFSAKLMSQIINNHELIFEEGHKEAKVAKKESSPNLQLLFTQNNLDINVETPDQGEQKPTWQSFDKNETMETTDELGRIANAFSIDVPNSDNIYDLNQDLNNNNLKSSGNCSMSYKLYNFLNKENPIDLTTNWLKPASTNDWTVLNDDDNSNVSSLFTLESRFNDSNQLPKKKRTQ